MGVLLLRSNNLPPLRILYLCLLTYCSSNIDVPSALSGPGAFPPTLTLCSTVNVCIRKVLEGCRRVLAFSMVSRYIRSRGKRILVYADWLALPRIASNMAIPSTAAIETENVSSQWRHI